MPWTPASAGVTSHRHPPRTTFVNLWHNPDGIVDAHQFAARAVSYHCPRRYWKNPGTALAEKLNGQHVGEVVSIPEADLAGKQWFGVQFARADMTRSATRLLGRKGKSGFPARC